MENNVIPKAMFLQEFPKTLREFCRSYCRECRTTAQAVDRCTIIKFDAWKQEKEATEKQGYLNRRKELVEELFS